MQNDRHTHLSPVAGTTTLATDFRVRDETELRVKRTSILGIVTLMIAGVDYTMTGLNVDGGAFVNLMSATAAGDEFDLDGLTIIERVSDYDPEQTPSGDQIDEDLNRLTDIAQELRRDIDTLDQADLTTAVADAEAAAASAVAAALSSAASAAAFASAVAVNFGNAGGTANNIELTHASVVGMAVWPADMLLAWRFTAANLGGMTVKVGPIVAAKPFRDVTGDAFAGGEFQIGDVALALYNSTNDQVRLLQRIVDVARTDKANSFSLAQTFANAANAAIFNGKATFNKQQVFTKVTLTDAPTIAWDLDTGSHFEVTLTASRALGAFTNGTDGQKGTLRVIQPVGGACALDLTNAVYDFSGNGIAGALIEPISQGANEITEYEWERIGAASMRLKRKWMSGRNSIGFWKDYDKGALAINTAYTQAHGLGRYPALAEVYLECTSAELGFAVGDRVSHASLNDVGAGNRRMTLAMNATNVFARMSSTGSTLIDAAFNGTGITPANWKVIIRIYE